MGVETMQEIYFSLVSVVEGCIDAASGASDGGTLVVVDACSACPSCSEGFISNASPSVLLWGFSWKVKASERLTARNVLGNFTLKWER